MSSTTYTTTISSKGQVVIPKEVRELLSIHYGDHFTIEIIENKIVFSLSQYNKKLSNFRSKIKTKLKEKNIKATDEEIRLAKEKMWQDN